MASARDPHPRRGGRADGRASMKRIALSRWLDRFEPRPSVDTVRGWAAAGTIKLWQGKPGGRIYVIEEETVPVVTADELLDAFRRSA